MHIRHRGRPWAVAVAVLVLASGMIAACVNGVADEPTAEAPTPEVRTFHLPAPPEPLCTRLLGLNLDDVGIVGYVGYIGDAAESGAVNGDLDQDCMSLREASTMTEDTSPPTPSAEQGIPGVVVNLIGSGANGILGDGDDTVEQSVNTGLGGCYAFVDLPPATTWRVEVPERLDGKGLHVGCAAGGIVDNGSTVDVAGGLTEGHNFGYAP
jgi:hypothetical protein